MVHNKSVTTLSSLFFLYSLLLIPFFNDSPNVPAQFRSISYIFLVSLIFIYVIESLKKNSFKLKLSNSLIFLIMLLILSFSFSFLLSVLSQNNPVHSVYYQISRYMSMLFKVLILIFTIHFINAISIKKINKYIYIGYNIMIIYVIFEIIFVMLPYYIFHDSNWGIFNFIDPIFHERSHDIGARSRGFAFEPSYQVLVLLFFLPFIFSSKKYLLLFLIASVATLSPVMLVTIIIFFIFYRLKGWKLLFTNIFLLVVSLIICNVFLSGIDPKTMTSTITRIGSLIATLSTIKENLFFGVGPGMTGYWIIFNYPDFFYLSVESANWYTLGLQNYNAPTFAAPLTLLLEYGLIPFLIVISYFFKYKIFSYIYNTPLARASLASMAIGSFDITSYGFYGFIVFFAITVTKKWHLFDKHRG